MKNELDIIRDVSQKLERLGLPFMLTGSIALNYYAQPRMTRDIDIVVAIAPADVPRLAEAFEAEYYLSRESVQAAVHDSSQFNLIHQESVIKVDCILQKDSEHARIELERRQRISLGTLRTFIVSKEDLILAKLSWARATHSEVQLGDVRNLIATGYDRVYIEYWAPRLGLADLFEECLYG